MKSLNIHAKEWHDKINGNSYFAAIITIDNDKQINLPFQYGYGDQYLHEAKSVLTEHNYISTNYGQNLSLYCRENNINLTYKIDTKCLQREVKQHKATY